MTVLPSLTGGGTISAPDGYGCLLPPANVNPKNTDLQGCAAKTATGIWVSAARNGTVALMGTPRAGWHFMGWQGCNSVNNATCTSTVSVFDADYSTTPRAIFREIVPVSIDAKPAAFTSGTTPTFGFSSQVAGTTFACQIDTSAVPCGGTSVTLPDAPADGSHTFRVIGTHNTNPSITPATYTFTVSETFKLVSSEPTGATFECSLDAAAFAPCDAMGCPSGLKGKGFTKKNAFGTVTLAKFIKKPLKAGDTITIVVSKPEAINAIKVVKLRASKKPLITTKCQPPGAKSSVSC